MTALHEDEIPLPVELVRALVDRALPDLSGRPLRPLDSSGSSNAMFRLGDDLLVRLPRQPGGTAAIDKERRWSPLISSALRVEVPETVAVCEPDLGYPERWSVTGWIDGVPPLVETGDGVRRGPRHVPALDLASVVTALRDLEVPPEATSDLSLRSYRGGPLRAIDEDVRSSLDACRTLPDLDLDLAAVGRAWDSALDEGDAGEALPDRWYHGDLLAENLLVRDGRLVAVLDLGGLAVGDPAVDLIAAWEVLDRSGRAVFREAVGVNDPTWARARGWALAIAVLTFPYYWHTMPARCADRLAMARAVLTDDA